MSKTGHDYLPCAISPVKFALWLRDAAVGEHIAYATGCRLDCDGIGPETPRRARAAYRAGHVMLWQRRVGPGCYEYLAVRCVPQGPRRMVGDQLIDVRRANYGESAHRASAIAA